MLVVWIALWSVALILCLADPRSSVNRRLSAVALFGGAGALAATLDNVFIPYFQANHPHPRVEDILYTLQAGSSLASYYGLPYSFLLFGMAYNPSNLTSQTQRAIQLALLIPIVLCVLFTPPYNEYRPVSHSVIVWWAVPYFLVGTYIVLTKNPGISRYPTPTGSFAWRCCRRFYSLWR